LSDEYKLRKQVEEGVRAKSVLTDDAFQKAYNDVGAAITEAWQSCPLRDRDGAHELRLLWKLHKDYLGHLQKAVDDGKFAAEELKQDKTFTQRLQERLRIA
jgi:hypothetical protein